MSNPHRKYLPDLQGWRPEQGFDRWPGVEPAQFRELADRIAEYFGVSNFAMESPEAAATSAALAAHAKAEDRERRLEELRGIVCRLLDDIGHPNR